MGKRIMIVIALLLVTVVAGCSALTAPEELSAQTIAPAEEPAVQPDEENAPVPEETAISVGEASTGKDINSGDMIPVIIEVNGTSFEAELFHNETTQAFLEQMPLTIEMRDVNGNEKAFTLTENLPHADTEKPDAMQAGEIMLWSSNTIVLFYESFPNSYGGYVRLGQIIEAAGIAKAAGPGNIVVTLSMP